MAATLLAMPAPPRAHLSLHRSPRTRADSTSTNLAYLVSAVTCRTGRALPVADAPHGLPAYADPMIVVVGVPSWRAGDDGAPAGLAARVALAAARSGARVELAGRVGDDEAGDRLLHALSRAGVGHSAVLRDPARATPTVAPTTDDDSPSTAARSFHTSSGALLRLDAADLELALSYLPDYRVVVVAEPLPEAAVRTVIDAAGYAGARLVVLANDATTSDAFGPAATVLAAPDEDDGSFAALVGTYAAGLDRGTEPEQAFRAAVEM